MSQSNIDAYLRTTNDIKTRILSLSTNLENMIQVILGTFYTNSDEEFEKFTKIFFNDRLELGFHKSILMFQFFLESEHPDFIENHSDFINQLQRIRRLRNNFAHAMNPEEKDLPTLCSKPHMELIFLEDGEIKTKIIPFKDIEERFNDISTIKKTMEDLWKEVQKEKGERITNLLDSLASQKKSTSQVKTPQDSEQ